MERHVDPMTARWDELLGKLERLVCCTELFVCDIAPQTPAVREQCAEYWAFRWEKTGETGKMEPVEYPDLVNLDDLVGIDAVKEELVRNTAQFVACLPANNVLLWGERGNGKSSCVKGLLRRFAAQGLRLIEVQRWDLFSLPTIVSRLRGLPFRFILFCDDLSFSEQEADFRGLKTLLDGGVEARPDNVLIYATSNRRHLLPEAMADNTGGAEIHPEEAVSEKLSLSDRFGISLAFDPFDQETYLGAVYHYAEQRGLPLDEQTLHREALIWAVQNGRRSGRSARQFIDDLAGKLMLAGNCKGMGL